MEEAGGRLIDGLAPASLAPDALHRVFERLDAPGLTGLEPPRSDRRLGDVTLPHALDHVALASRRFLTPGLWAARIQLDQADGWRTFLLRASAGTTIPMHKHEGRELITVLTGAFHDGRSFRAGDFGENVAGSGHRLKVSADGPCACLFTVQGRINWRGWAKVITPVLGI